MLRLFIFWLVIITWSVAAAQEPSALTQLAVGDEKPPRPEPLVFNLAVSPAAEASPAHKYTLLPPFRERSSDNAAPLYLRGLLFLQGNEGVRADAKVWENLSTWATTDVDKLPQDEVRKTLAMFHAGLGEARLAARRDHCDWAMGVESRPNIFATLLPEAQAMREFGLLLAVEARLHIAAGEFDEALRSLQVGYALARHVAEQPFLVSSLVGLAITSRMDEQLQTLMAAPGSPNLYWAIAALPNPLIDLRPALDFEGHSLFLMFPELRDVRERKLTADQWRVEFGTKARKAAELMMLIEPEKEKGLGALAKELARAAAIEAMLELRVPGAKKDLLAWGYDEKRLDEMAKGQLVLVHEVEYFERSRDEMFKWFDIPYWQAFDGLQAADAAFKARATKHGKLRPMADFVLPAMATVYGTEVRFQQRRAALQSIEALRMYAAAHEGRFPPALDAPDLRPIPINPFTGKLPDYAVADDVATVTYVGRGREADLVYKVKLAK